MIRLKQGDRTCSVNKSDITSKVILSSLSLNESDEIIFPEEHDLSNYFSFLRLEKSNKLEILEELKIAHYIECHSYFSFLMKILNEMLFIYLDDLLDKIVSTFSPELISEINEMLNPYYLPYSILSDEKYLFRLLRNSRSEEYLSVINNQYVTLKYFKQDNGVERLTNYSEGFEFTLDKGGEKDRGIDVSFSGEKIIEFTYYYDGKPRFLSYNTYVENYFYEDGRVRKIKKIGDVITYEAEFVNNLLDGKETSYYASTGKIESVKEWKNGIKDGDEFTFNEDGEIINKIVWKDNKMTGKIKVPAYGGDIRYVNFVDGNKDGVEEIWSQDLTTLKASMTWSKGKKDGLEIHYLPKSYRIIWKNGKRTSFSNEYKNDNL